MLPLLPACLEMGFDAQCRFPPQEVPLTCTHYGTGSKESEQAIQSFSEIQLPNFKTGIFTLILIASGVAEQFSQNKLRDHIYLSPNPCVLGTPKTTPTFGESVGLACSRTHSQDVLPRSLRAPDTAESGGSQGRSPYALSLP